MSLDGELGCFVRKRIGVSVEVREISAVAKEPFADVGWARVRRHPDKGVGRPVIRCGAYEVVYASQRAVGLSRPTVSIFDCVNTGLAVDLERGTRLGNEQGLI